MFFVLLVVEVGEFVGEVGCPVWFDQDGGSGGEQKGRSLNFAVFNLLDGVYRDGRKFIVNEDLFIFEQIFGNIFLGVLYLLPDVFGR